MQFASAFNINLQKIEKSPIFQIFNYTVEIYYIRLQLLNKLTRIILLITVLKYVLKHMN